VLVFSRTGNNRIGTATKDPSVPMLSKIRGGNDRLPHAVAEPLRENLRYGAVVVRIVQKPQGVEVTHINAGSHNSVLADYVICTLPFTVLRGIEVDPPWSPKKAFAIQNLYMGPVARVYAQSKPASGKQMVATDLPRWTKQWKSGAQPTTSRANEAL